MFVGIVASGAWGEKNEVRLPLGQPVEAAGVTLTYRGHVAGTEPKDRWRVAVMRPGETEELLQVRMYSKGEGEDGRPQTMRFPAIHREFSRDVYVAPLALEPAGEGNALELAKGRPVPYRDATLTFVKFATTGSSEQHVMTVHAEVSISRGPQQETVSLPMKLEEGRLAGEAVSPKSLPGVSLKLGRIAVEQGLVVVETDDGSGGASEVLVVDASVKPLIGLLWAGTILIGLGCTLAAIRRYLELRTMPAAPAPIPIPAPAPVAPGLGITLGMSAGSPAERNRPPGDR
jgi:hypothetical protein